MSSNPKIGAEQLKVGQEYELVVAENLSRTQIVQYAGASGDFNPIHHDEVFARKAGYPSVFAHGMLTMGLSGTLLTEWLGDGVLRSFGVRFVRQVWPGDTLTGKASVKSLSAGENEGLVEIELVTSNQKGETVVAGQATAALPHRG